MAKQNKGKAFEKWTESYLQKNGHFAIRLRDVGLIEGRRTKSTQNPCDIHSLNNGNAYYIECKANKTDRFSISRLEMKNKTSKKSQLDLLLEAKGNGGISLVAIWFYEQKRKVIVELEAILQHDMRSIKFDDNICWNFDEYWQNKKIEE
ncbi:hypothetical protein [Culicoidibacter larvae]|uniref:Holliday junction resolvase n=1 Tax=Culicoidibacter larvae TaxID=2579976 RepID=A0A5R8QB02_9FIRM|nr:hypothetical protein [Culicoidibacter larvae]TLG72070.1 hypothetical protein FEZ08_09565 [Culicoidibacter larvae]